MLKTEEFLSRWYRGTPSSSLLCAECPYIVVGNPCAAARRAPCARPPADRHRLATSSPPPFLSTGRLSLRRLPHAPSSPVFTHPFCGRISLPSYFFPSTPLKTAQNRPFCKRIQPPRLSIAADRAPEDLLKIPVCKFSCKFMARKNGSRTHRPAPVAYSALSSSPLSPLSRSTSSAFLSASGTGTPSRPQFSTILRPSLAT